MRLASSILQRCLQFVAVSLLLTVTVGVGGAEAQDEARGGSRSGRPIIDMHLHAVAVDQDLPAALGLLNPITGNPAPTSGLEHMRESLAMMERYNIVSAIVSGSVDSIRVWREAAPARVLGSLEISRPGFGGMGEALPELDRLTAWYRDGTLAAMGEVTAQYEGFSPSDAGYEPYFALAEALDVPVGIHTGTSAPGTAYRGKPNFRVSLGDPMLIEDVLVRHPNLRVYLMHGGYPWDREAQAIMQQYPQVYMDISPLWLNFENPLFEEFMAQEMRKLISMGLFGRVMFGTDQMLWPESIGMAIGMIESSDVLSEEQKRDILYNNAARFLRLSDEEIAAHHSQAPSTVAPGVADEVSPIELVHPVAQDDYVGQALLRKPPGNGPFPGILLIPGGVVPPSLGEVRDRLLQDAVPAHFLEQGFVVATLTHRRRDTDVQSQAARDDAVAVVDHLKGLPFIDAGSIAIFGCSSGGDLALAVAAVESVAAIVLEEPASPMFMGVLTNELFESPENLSAISTDPLRFYTSAARRVARDRIDGIQSPILILQGDMPIPQAQDVNKFNELVLIPELRAAGKPVEVMTYPGGFHCFVSRSVDSDDLASKAIQDADEFIRRHIRADPRPL